MKSDQSFILLTVNDLIELLLRHKEAGRGYWTIQCDNGIHDLGTVRKDFDYSYPFVKLNVK